MITNPTHVLLGTNYDKSFPVSWFETKLGRQAVDPKANAAFFLFQSGAEKAIQTHFLR